MKDTTEMSIKFSFEVPNKLLGTFQPINDFEYVLCKCLDNPTYRLFYQQDFGRQKILDNDLHENGGRASDFSRILKAAITVKPTHIICPDYLDSMTETIDSFRSHAPVIKEKGYGVLAVAQGRDFNELNQCIDTYLKAGCRYVGLPFDSAAFKSSKFGRLSFIEQNQQPVCFHMLGLQNPNEFKHLTQKSKHSIFSWDTSNPVTFGIQQHEYTDFEEASKPNMKIADNLDIDVNERQKNSAIYNAKLLKLFTDTH